MTVTLNALKITSKARPPAKIPSFFDRGSVSSRPFSASSYPFSARAGKVSVSRLIQRICTGLRIVNPSTVAPKMESTSLTLLESRELDSLADIVVDPPALAHPATMV